MLLTVGVVLGLALLLAAVNMRGSGRNDPGSMSEQWLVEYNSTHPGAH